MAIKRILIQLDTQPSCVDRLKSCQLLANAFNADVNGVYIEPDYAQQLSLDNHFLTQNTTDVNQDIIALQEQRAEDKRMIQEMVDQFEDASFKNIDWTFETGSRRAVLSKLGQFNDMIVMTNSLDDDPLFQVKPPASEIAVNTRSPVLVIPEGKPLNGPLKKILIIWNGQPEASRAIHSALPLIALTRNSTLFCYGDEQLGSNSYLAARTQLTDYLQSHQIEINLIDRFHSTPNNIINRLISEEWQTGEYQLVIAGAFDHSKLRELLFSSTTKQLLQREEMPLILAH